ncbi:MAG: RNA pyrophosphohydrolase [Deltaproteobacteria bacterium]|nr:RNA pyrophosphohydrolase [Deltaproteobacteria bacterium]
MGKHQSFRANVGVVVVDARGQVLALRRAGSADAWQMPQGGLKVGEEPREAAIRELGEETGLRPGDIEIVREHPQWLAYELPEAACSQKTGRGQVQKWFLCRLTDPDAGIALPGGKRAEFDAFRWMGLDELCEHTWEVRRPIYRELARFFAPHLPAASRQRQRSGQS